MTNHLSDPSMLSFLLDYPNSILVIEDAENVLEKRQGGSNQAISNLLNLSDGLLSDCLNIQIVATFNANIHSVDDALLRKGRLIAKYEFTELTEERTEKLCKKLGVHVTNTKLLTDIYNSTDRTFTNSNKKKIGY